MNKDLDQTRPLDAGNKAAESTLAPDQGGSTTPVPNIRNWVAKLPKKPTRVNAIKAMCCHCMGCTSDYYEPGTSEMIRDCTSASCPLYRYRPYRQEIV